MLKKYSKNKTNTINRVMKFAVRISTGRFVSEIHAICVTSFFIETG